MECLDSIGVGPMEHFCEHCNEPFGFINFCPISEWLCNLRLLKKGSPLWNQFYIANRKHFRTRTAGQHPRQADPFSRHSICKDLQERSVFALRKSSYISGLAGARARSGALQVASLAIDSRSGGRAPSLPAPGHHSPRPDSQPPAHQAERAGPCSA
jgi:hypothetical protein